MSASIESPNAHPSRASGPTSFREAHYRADIDGLRALAVSIVVLFHLAPHALTGGYIGVDIFFVISGYLITKIIVNETQKYGKFDFGRFYVRRVRRLFPAMFVTVFFTTIAAVFIFSNQQLHEYLSEAVFTVTSLSNVYFWSQAGYFDAEAITKPLLHTWSLAVEEQFYIVWPMFSVLVLARFRTRNAIFALIAISFFSFWANIVWIRMGNLSSIFFLTPFRGFEFGIGAAVVWLEKKPISSAVFKEILVAAGLGAIMWAAIVYDEQTIFPAENALIPCIGAALVIYAGRTSKLAWVLRNKLAVSVGLISYSLYLVHWPMIVFFVEITGHMPDWLEILGLVVAMIILASLMYHSIEQPFRKGNFAGIKNASGGAVGFSVAMLCIVTVLPAYYFQQTADEAVLYGDAVIENSKEYTWEHIHQQKGAFDPQNSGENVLLIGDSQAADLLNLLWSADPEYGAQIRTIASNKFCQIKTSQAFFDTGDYKDRFTASANQIEKCQREIRQYETDTRIEDADVIILAYAWYKSAAEYLPQDIENLRERNPDVRILIAGRKDQPRSSIYYLSESIEPLAANILARENSVSEVTIVNDGLSVISDTQFLDMYATICGVEACDLFTYSQYPVLFDKRHFTEFGVAYIAQSDAFTLNIADPLQISR